MSAAVNGGSGGGGGSNGVAKIYWPRVIKEEYERIVRNYEFKKAKDAR